MSNIRALKYLELLLRLGCTLNVENEIYFATRYKFCRWWLSKLSKCKKNRWFPPHTPLGGAAAALGVSAPRRGILLPRRGAP